MNPEIMELQPANGIDNNSASDEGNENDNLNGNVSVTHVVDDCSLACWKLPFLNRLRSPAWFLFFMTLAACLQGMCINGLVNVVITTLEKRFSIPSKESGMIVSFYNIGSCVFMLPIAYLGGKTSASKPKWIAGGMLVMGLGSFVFTLPHFLSQTQTIQEAEEHLSLCGSDEEKTGCDQEDGVGGLAAHGTLFIVGQLLHGLGTGSLLSLGTSFLDESVSQGSSPLYIGIFMSSFFTGPALGFIVGSQLLSIHTDLVNDENLTPESPLWVGAWWPGFLITSVLSFIVGFCIFCFPNSINKERSTYTELDNSPSFVKGLPSSLRSLLTNPTFMCICLAAGGDYWVLASLGAYLPKYIEQQYQYSNSMAGLIVGLIVVPFGGAANVLSGFLIKKWKLSTSCNKIILMCLLSQVISIPAMLAFSPLISCPSPEYVGVNHIPANFSSSSPFTFSCNAECSCPTTKFDPVCGTDSLMYLSPCLAGCSQSSESNSFTNCVCIDDGGSAERKICETDCNSFILFVFITIAGIFLTFFTTSPSVSASFLAVQENEKALSYGVLSITFRLVGSIPGPVVFGTFLDRSCLQWESTCDDTGSCLLYDNYWMSIYIFGLCMVGKTVSVVFYGLAWLASKKSHMPVSVEEN